MMPINDRKNLPGFFKKTTIKSGKKRILESPVSPQLNVADWSPDMYRPEWLFLLKVAATEPDPTTR